MTTAVMQVLIDGGTFFEGPRWHDGHWWVSDFYRHRVLAIGPDGRSRDVMTVPGRPSGLGFMPDGSLLVVSMTDHRVLRRRPDGSVEEHADLTDYCTGHANDMVVDAHGRAYVGNFGYDVHSRADLNPAALICVEPDGRTRIAAEGLMFPNGAVITPDGRTLIVGETAASRYTAFTIADNGALTDRRVWAQVDDAPAHGPIGKMLMQSKFTPDGCTLDAEGHIWAADALGGRCCRVAPGGEIVDVIDAPAGLGIFACMLGGEDGRTLLLCAAPDFAEQRRMENHEAVLLTTTVDVPHAGRP